MKKISYCILGFLGLAAMLGFVNFSNKKVEKIVYLTYKHEWAEIDSIIRINQSETALKKVDSIFQLAKESDNQPQQIKALIYKTKIYTYKDEESTIKAIADFSTEIEAAKPPMKQLLQSVTAELYWKYYQQNRWQIMNRTVVEGFEQEDIRTWDAKKHFQKVSENYLASIQDIEETKKYDLANYKAILQGKEDSYTPTLYDFLAQRALFFFQSNEPDLAQSSYYFELDNTQLLSDVDTFTNLNFETKDSTSSKLRALTIFQDLLKFHQDDQDKSTFITLAIRRAVYVHREATFENKGELYLNELTRLTKEYQKNTRVNQAYYLIARAIYDKGITYKKWQNDETKELVKEALSICEDVIAKNKRSVGLINCKALKQEILQKEIDFKVEEYLIPDDNFKVFAKYKNVDQLFVRVIKTSEKEYESVKPHKDSNREYVQTKDYIHFYREKETKQAFQADLIVNEDYQNHSTELAINGLPIGHYVLLIGSNEAMDFDKGMVAIEKVQVTGLSYLTRNVDEGLEIITLDRKSGNPLEGIEVQVYSEKYNYTYRKRVKRKEKKYQTDKNGRILVLPIDKDGRDYLTFDFKNGDDVLSSSGKSVYHYNVQDYDAVERTHFFTDRAIYRPGQTVYFKGIVMASKGNTHEVKTNSRQHVELRDANYQSVEGVNLVTNDYGSFSGSFVIPQGRMNGRFQIQTNTGSVSIQVEEYKRPKFEVVIDPFQGDYQLNDSVKVSGQAKALAGNNITDAKVVYRVVRKANWSWWRWSPNVNASREITQGVLTTDASGKFDLSFMAFPDNAYPKSGDPTFTYEVFVDVTDISGETRRTSSAVTIGYKSLVLSVNIPAQLEKKKEATFELTTNNLNGVFLPSKGIIEINKLKDPKIPFTSSLWGFPDSPILSKEEYRKQFPLAAYGDEKEFEHWVVEQSVFSQSFDTEKSKEIKLKKLNKWKEGVYQILLKSSDKYGKEVIKIQYVVLYDRKSNELPYASQEWLVPLQGKVEPGQKAAFLIGSSLNQKVLVEVEHDDRIVKSYWLILNNEQKLIEFPVEEKHRGNFVIHFTYTKENRSHTLTETVEVPFTNKQLNIQFETFRDKLLPGQKEEWRLKIAGPKGDKLAAELVATLYDASLEQFVKHRFGMSLYSSYYAQRNWQAEQVERVATFQEVNEAWRSYLGYSSYYYQHLNWFGLNSFSHYSYRNVGVEMMEYELEEVEEVDDSVSRSRSMKKSAPLAAPAVKMSFTANEKKAELEPEEGTEGNQSEQSVDEPIVPRTNFNETAFFYPQLETDENGAVIIKFTIPEALTRWKMLGLAHTKDLKVGTIENELVTQKELMITANAPRFFREGDRIFFSAKVSNLSPKELSGTAKLELFDALTMKPINEVLGLKQIAQNFVVAKDGNEALVWEMVLPETVQAVTYRISARAENHTDGEEMTVPVLSNRMLVTESLTLPIRGKQTKSFTFDKLVQSGQSSTLKNHKLTLEFTSNPAWYAIQSLPYLMEYPYECSEQTFSRLYANSIASHIVNSNPKIKQVFEQWKTQTPDALLSNLEKNQELKSLLLQETPWVREAKGESERKRRVAILFDLNRMANEELSAINRLKKLQTSNGGWAWFDGMRDDRYITQHIVTGFGKLNKLGVLTENNAVDRMAKSGVSYTDHRITEDYKALQKLAKKGVIKMEDNHLGYTQIHYLYMRSFYPSQSVSRADLEAYNYYFDQAVKYWHEQSTYMQGMLAIALHRAKEDEVPHLIVRSFRENALHSEELGTYWKTTSGYYWYQAPIESQTMMAEVFKEVADDQKMLEGIQTWLIKNKQTYDWETTKATVEACYVLLMDNTKWVTNDEQVKITVAGQEIDPSKLEDVKVEAGTGYFKTSWSGSDITPEMGNVTLTKNTDDVAFGALYWQYFEQLDKITTAETPLKLKKKLFLEVKTDAGLVLKPIEEHTVISPGDRVIVRIELQVDRVMEYIHMKDMRASGLEPENVISSYKYQGGLGYYESTKDASTNFFISYLPKGTFVFEYPLRVTHKGDFSNGITTIQCMYAPEFTAHSEGIRLNVK